jgi:hypothetical protein
MITSLTLMMCLLRHSFLVQGGCDGGETDVEEVFDASQQRNERELIPKLKILAS